MIKSFLILILLSSQVYAHPTSYKGAKSVMTWMQPFLWETWNSYSLDYDKAIAVRYQEAQMPNGRMKVAAPQLNWLAKRWNGSDYQANVYLYGGYGSAWLGQQQGGLGFGGIEIDAEDRQYYSMAKAEWMKADFGRDSYSYAARLGIAPYASAFDELAAWLMVQFQYHDSLIRKSAVTPLARFYYRNVLWEIGMSTDGDAMANLMFHF
jgi:hypothetical protein